MALEPHPLSFQSKVVTVIDREGKTVERQFEFLNFKEKSVIFTELRGRKTIINMGDFNLPFSHFSKGNQTSFTLQSRNPQLNSYQFVLNGCQQDHLVTLLAHFNFSHKQVWRLTELLPGSASHTETITLEALFAPLTTRGFQEIKFEFLRSKDGMELKCSQLKGRERTKRVELNGKDVRMCYLAKTSGMEFSFVDEKAKEYLTVVLDETDLRIGRLLTWVMATYLHQNKRPWEVQIVKAGAGASN